MSDNNNVENDNDSDYVYCIYHLYSEGFHEGY